MIRKFFTLCADYLRMGCGERDDMSAKPRCGIQFYTKAAIAMFVVLCVTSHSAYADSDEDYPEYAAYDGKWIDIGGDFVKDKITAENLVKGIKWGLNKIELTKGYQSPIGAKEREMMVKSITARHGKLWIPRKLSTTIARLEQGLGVASDFLKAADSVLTVGKIIGIAAGANSFDDAVDLFAEERIFQDSEFGEAGYWASTIFFGMTHGKSFVESIIDGYDEKNIGYWTKLGAKLGGWVADGVIMLTEDTDAKAAADKAFRDYLIVQGINANGLAVVDKWLSLSSEDRVKMPLVYDSSWFEGHGSIKNQTDWLKIIAKTQDGGKSAVYSLGADITIDFEREGGMYTCGDNHPYGSYVTYRACQLSGFTGTIKGNGHKIFIVGKAFVSDGVGSCLIESASGATFENVTFCGRGVGYADNCEFSNCGIEGFPVAKEASSCRFEKCGGTAAMMPLKYGTLEFCGRGAIACKATNCEFLDCRVDGSVGGEGLLCYSGALVGQAEKCSFVNCLTTAAISCTDIAGGMVGWAEDCEFSSCTATGAVSGNDCVGGLVGYSSESLFSKCLARGNVIGGKTVGGFVGDLRGKSVVECYATGDVYCEKTLTGAPADIGGFAGKIIEGATLEDCAATGSISASGATEVGGFAGSAHGEVLIQRCYASGKAFGGSFVGGFAGTLLECKIYNCYATGGAEAEGIAMGDGIAGSSSAYAGGFAGEASSAGGVDCRYCYATGKVLASGGDAMKTIAGGLTPLSVPDSMASTMGPYLSMLMSDCVECYWDVSATGCNYSGMGIGLGGTAIKDSSSFLGWDSSVWTFNGGYPYFTKLGKTGEIPNVGASQLPAPTPISEPTSGVGTGTGSGGGSGRGTYWDRTYCTVTLDFNGGNGGIGSSFLNVQVKSGEAVGYLPAPTRAGYSFDGWWTAKSGGFRITAETKVTSSVTYYAHWRAKGSSSGGSSGGNLSGDSAIGGRIPDMTFAKTQVVTGALYRDGNLVGSVQMKAGKINVRKDTVNLTIVATVLADGKVKKVTVRATLRDASEARSARHRGTLSFKAPIGAMTFVLNTDGTFSLTNASYAMGKATVGGTLKSGSRGTFRLEGFNLAVPGELLGNLLPYEVSFGIAGTRWQFAKTAAVKWVKDRSTGESVLVADSDNPSSLKLSYVAKTGVFKGSFKAYALETVAGGKKKLQKYTVNVIGIVADGIGQGEASCRRPSAGPWKVTVK